MSGFDGVKAILRNVVGVVAHRNPGYGKHWAVGGRNWLVLSCGHDTSRKFSDGVPKRARCHPCENLRAGGTGRHGDMLETWDAVAGMPVRTPVAPVEGG